MRRAVLGVIAFVGRGHTRGASSTVAPVIRRYAVPMTLVIAMSCAVPDVTAPTADDHVRGPATAKVTLIEYGDYQCPPCVGSFEAVEKVLARHPTDLRFVYRHHPGRRHRNAIHAAKAAEAAEKQGKFWEMHAALYEGQQEWYASRTPLVVFERYALALDLDPRRFAEAFASTDAERRLHETFEAGQNVGVRGSPAFFLNGRRLIPPPMNEDDLERAIAAARRNPE